MKRETVFLKATVFFIAVIFLALCLFGLPWLASYTAEMYPEYAYLKFPVLAGIYIIMVPFFIALYQSLRLLSYIEKKNAFSDRSVASLRRIKHCAVAIIVFDIIGLLFLLSQDAVQPGVFLFGFAVIFGSLVISVFAAILQELLKSALALKEENDLTV